MMTIRKRGIILVGLIALYVAIMSLPTPDGLSFAGKSALALMLCGTIGMTVEVMPVEMIGFLLVTLQAPLQIATLNEAVARFAQPVFFFSICSFMVSVGFNSTGLDKRIVYKLTQMTKADPKRLLFVFMMGSGLLSTVFADLLVVIVLAPIALQILKSNNCMPGSSNLGKCLMIGIPIAALIGGSGTPLGSMMNILAQSMVSEFINVNITFLAWSVIGMPIVILTLPVAYKILTLVYPIEIDRLQGMEKIYIGAEKLGKITNKEKRFIFLFTVMVIGCSTEAIHGLNTSFIASVVAALMLVTGVIDWDTCNKQVSWSMIIGLYGIASLGMSIYQTGASDWIANGMASMIGGKPFMVVVVALGLFTILVHLVVPVNQALITILVPIAIGLATVFDANPVFLALVVAFCVHIGILLPLDVVPLIVYPHGYYKMYEMFKPGLLISVIWFLIVLVIVNITGPILGLG